MATAMITQHYRTSTQSAPVRSKSFVLLFKFETIWTLPGRRRRGFFFFFFFFKSKLNQPPTFAFHEPAPDFIILLTALRATSSSLINSFLAFFKTIAIFAHLFRTSGLPLRFLSSKVSFCRWPFYFPAFGFFKFFLAISWTDKSLD